MDIAKKYEDLVAERDAALAREAEVGRLYDSLVNRSNRERDASYKREDALREELERANSRYNREVFGLNNEGDPIGGDPAGGYKNDIARLQQRLTVAEQRAERFEALLLESNELLYVIQDGLGANLSSAVDEVRGKVFTALKPAAEGEGS